MAGLEMTLNRQNSADGATLGELLLDGVHECWTLEDVIRPDAEKVPGKTCIPQGRYKVTLTPSAKFKGRIMPRLANVPNFEGILIHFGNTAEDTEGCILVGTTKAKAFVGHSQIAFAALFAKLEAADQAGDEISIAINSPPAAGG